MVDSTPATTTSKTEVTLTFTMTDGTTKAVVFDVLNGAAGTDGKDAPTIKAGTVMPSQITNQDGTTSTQADITLTLSDGTSIPVTGLTIPNGKDGTDGTNGTDGKDGTNGTDGKDGVGITDVTASAVVVGG